MRLADLPRTGSFRLAVLFLALFGAASAGLFGFLYLQTQRFQIASIDDWLAREAPPPFAPLAEVRRRFDMHASHYDPRRDQIFVLYDAAGARIAGEQLAVRLPILALDRPFSFTIRMPRSVMRYRALARRYPGGETAVTAQNLHRSHEFDEALVRTMIWGGVLTAVLGLGGAVIVGMGTVRRLNAVAFAIQEIVRGDLSRRLPTHGTSGDLDRLVGVVNAMLDDIERLMDDVKGVCDGIAHDLRTPLTRILAALERAQRRAETTEDYALAVEDAVAELRTMLRIFAAMLRIAEIEDGARRSGFSTVDVARVAGDVIDVYDPAAEDKSVALALSAPERLTMAGDAGLLFAALANLVDNAIKFTPAGGTVRLLLDRNEGRVTMAVADTGCGIAEAEREAVLRRFYRSEQSRSAPGNGLGLALVAAIARLHHLDLTIAPAHPGTRITLAEQPAVD